MKASGSLTFLLFIALFSSSVSAGYKAYFNHRETVSYTDPYRNITRNGDNLEQVILDHIKSAKKSIKIAIQELRLPLIAIALREAKEKGIIVQVILENNYHNTFATLQEPTGSDIDDHDSSRFYEFAALLDINNDGFISEDEINQRDAIQILKNAKIKIIDDTFDNSNGSGLMHHKFIIVDESSVLISTANFTMSCIHGDVLTMGSLGNANSLIVTDLKKMTAAFNQEFELMWGNGGVRSKFGLNKPYRGAVIFNAKSSTASTSQSVQFSPTTKRNSWESSVNGLIGKTLKTAKSEILMALFVFSEQRLSNILQTKKEGKPDFSMGILVEPKFAYRDYSELLDIWGLELRTESCVHEPRNNPWKIPFYDVGVPRLGRGDMLHHKFAVIDEKTLVLGSQNWSDSANTTNDENLVVISDPALALEYKEEYLRLSRSSRMGPPKTLLSRIADMDEYCRTKE